jgi:hypothetical protein
VLLSGGPWTDPDVHVHTQRIQKALKTLLAEACEFSMCSFLAPFALAITSLAFDASRHRPRALEKNAQKDTAQGVRLSALAALLLAPIGAVPWCAQFRPVPKKPI